jgi:hypothetical protein
MLICIYDKYTASFELQAQVGKHVTDAFFQSRKASGKYLIQKITTITFFFLTAVSTDSSSLSKLIDVYKGVQLVYTYY